MQTRFSSRTLHSYARLVPQWTAACPSPFQWLCSRETRCRPAVRSHAALYQSLPAPCTAMYLHNTTFSCASALKISKPVHHIVYAFMEKFWRLNRCASGFRLVHVRACSYLQTSLQWDSCQPGASTCRSLKSWARHCRCSPARCRLWYPDERSCCHATISRQCIGII